MMIGIYLKRLATLADGCSIFYTGSKLRLNSRRTSPGRCYDFHGTSRLERNHCYCDGFADKLEHIGRERGGSNIRRVIWGIRR